MAEQHCGVWGSSSMNCWLDPHHSPQITVQLSFLRLPRVSTDFPFPPKCLATLWKLSKCCAGLIPRKDAVFRWSRGSCGSLASAGKIYELKFFRLPGYRSWQKKLWTTDPWEDFDFYLHYVLLIVHIIYIANVVDWFNIYSKYLTFISVLFFHFFSFHFPHCIL